MVLDVSKTRSNPALDEALDRTQAEDAPKLPSLAPTPIPLPPEVSAPVADNQRAEPAAQSAAKQRRASVGFGTPTKVHAFLQDGQRVDDYVADLGYVRGDERFLLMVYFYTEVRHMQHALKQAGWVNDRGVTAQLHAGETYRQALTRVLVDDGFDPELAGMFAGFVAERFHKAELAHKGVFLKEMLVDLQQHEGEASNRNSKLAKCCLRAAGVSTPAEAVALSTESGSVVSTTATLAPAPVAHEAQDVSLPLADPTAWADHAEEAAVVARRQEEQAVNERIKNKEIQQDERAAQDLVSENRASELRRNGLA